MYFVGNVRAEGKVVLSRVPTASVDDGTLTSKISYLTTDGWSTDGADLRSVLPDLHPIFEETSTCSEGTISRNDELHLT